MSTGDIVEEWRVIQTHPNYEVSNLGQVRRCVAGKGVKSGYMLKPCYRCHPNYLPRSPSYLIVSLCAEGKIKNASIHQLVTAAFLGNSNGLFVNHKDGNPTNNRLDNLEYVTPRQNAQHAHDIGLQDCRGFMNGQAKLSEAQVETILLNSRKRGQSNNLATRYGVSTTTIRDIWCGRCWEYVSERMRQDGRLGTPEPTDLNPVGMTFGRLTVLRQVPICQQPPKRARTRFLCQCSCGRRKEVERTPLLAGLTRSCGCLKSEVTIARNIARAHKT